MWILLATALAFSPQTDDDAPPVERPELEAPIVNGVDEPGFPQTVSLGAGPFRVCTGSMITPRLILTAAHCGADMPIEFVVEFGDAAFGQDALAPEQSIGLSDAYLHPDYKPLVNGGLTPSDLGEYDLGVLVLEADAPVDPIWFNETPLGDEVLGEELLSVGYGLDLNGVSGVRRSATLTIDSVDDIYIRSKNNTNENNANICSGDSGGPQYHLEGERIVQWSVHSWGDEGCLNRSGSTRTDIAADWILDIVEEVHGTTDRCAINSRYGDGICDSFCDAPDPDCGASATINSPAFTGAELPSGCATSPGGGWAGLLVLPLLLATRRS